MKFGQKGGGGKKIPKFCGRHIWMAPRKEKKSRRHHRSSALSAQGTLPLTEDELRSFASASDMERGLLETLMGAPDETSTLKRNKGCHFGIRIHCLAGITHFDLRL